MNKAVPSAQANSTKSSQIVIDKRPPRILVISSLIGYIEPCGCTIDLLLGGIARIATLVERERALGPTSVVLVGPHLFEKKVEPHRVAQEKAKAKLIARSLKHIGIHTVTLTPNELIHGPKFYEQIRSIWPVRHRCKYGQRHVESCELANIRSDSWA